MAFQGLMSPPVTPTHPNGDLNVDVIPQYVDYLIQNGVYGVYVCGTTGEGTAFNVAERKKIAEAWVQSGKNKLKYIIIQVGGFCLKDSEELARHAEGIGADAIATLAPLYHKPSTVDELVDYCAILAKAAPNTPFFYYHIPFLTGINVSIHDFLVKGSAKIPTLAGAKFTSTELFDLATCNTLDNGRFLVFSGFDELLGPALTVGTRAFIGATYNYAAKFSSNVIKAFSSGKMKEFQEEQEKLTQMTQIIKKHGQGVALFKEATDLATPFPVGPVRPPLRPLTPAARQALAEDMKLLDLLAKTG